MYMYYIAYTCTVYVHVYSSLFNLRVLNVCVCFGKRDTVCQILRPVLNEQVALWRLTTN